MTVDIADRITREHKISSISGNGKTEIAFCTCGARCENEDDGDDGFLAGYWRHIAVVTEVAVRQQAAAEIEAAAECRSWIADSALIQGMREAAEIARGEA